MLFLITKNQITKWEKNKKIRKIINALESDNNEIRKESAAALVRLGKPVVEYLIKKCSNAGIRIRSDAPAILAQICKNTKDEAVFQTIVQALKLKEDETGWINDVAAKTLGIIKDKKAEEPLIEVILSEYGSLNTDVVEALGKLKSKNAVIPLVKNMVNKDNYVEDAVITALIKIGGPSVDYLLETVDNSSNKTFKDAAVKLLKKLMKQKKMNESQINKFMTLSESGPVKTSIHRGGFGEPYCSRECYDEGGRYIAAVMLKKQTGVCGICKSPVQASMYGKSNCAIVPYEKMNLFICDNCTDKGKAFLKDYKKCCMCQKSI